jgi:hypothetical protein
MVHHKFIRLRYTIYRYTDHRIQAANAIHMVDGWGGGWLVVGVAVLSRVMASMFVSWLSLDSAAAGK